MSLGFNVTNALWPLYIQNLDATVLQVSFLISITGVAGTLLRIPSGLLSDLYGRRRIIVISTLLAFFPPLLFTFSNNWTQLIPWSIVYSIAFALFMPSRMAIIADYTPVERLMQVYSILNLSWPIGSLIGPTLSGLLENHFGWNTVFYMATLLYLFCIIPSLLLPKPSKKSVKEDITAPHHDERINSTFIRSLLPFFLLNLFTGLGIGSVNSITPIYLTERFKVSSAIVGLFISIGFGLIMILTQIPASYLADKIGRRKFIAICFSLIPFLFVLWTFARNIILLLLIQMAINSLWSMTWPATLSLLMEHVPKTRRGLSSGLTQSGIMLGFTVGPTIGGYLWEIFGKTYPYYAAAFFLAICIPITSFISDRKS